MIFDTLTQSDRYNVLSPHFEKAFAFLKSMSADLSIGRHEIDGDDVYALVQRYETSPVETRQYEVHREYLDVQYIHRGRELIFWRPLAELLEETMAYSVEHDAALYAYDHQGIPLEIGPGEFSILYPTDGHIPCCSVQDSEQVVKVVVKVRIN